MLNLKGLMDVLVELPTLPSVALVAASASASEAEVLRVARDGEGLRYVEVRPMGDLGPVVQLTPLGAYRMEVVLVDVRIRREDDWHEEPRWLPNSYAWWLLEDAARVGYPVHVEDEDPDAPARRGDVDRSQHEPIEYLIAEEEVQKRLGATGEVLPYPRHLYGMGRPWPLAVARGEGLDETRGLAGDGTDAFCPECHRSMADPVGYCAWCDSYGREDALPKVTRRPRAHRAQLSPRCSLAGGRGRSRTVERFLKRRKKEAREAG